MDTASEGIWELDEHYATTYVNRRMAEMLGYEPQEMVGRDFSEFLFEDDLASLPARIAARRQGLTERYEQKYRHKDGSTVWMQVSATSVRDAEHRFLGSFAMLTDITERKRAEEALRRSKSRTAGDQQLQPSPPARHRRAEFAPGNLPDRLPGGGLPRGVGGLCRRRRGQKRAACRVDRGRGGVSRKPRHYLGRYRAWARPQRNGHPDRENFLP